MIREENPNPVVMEEITDPVELAEARAQREQFDRNSAWLEAHASEVYPKHRGKCICIAGEELFVADTAREAVAKAMAAHPDDKGRFVRYIPKEKVPRIYAWLSTSREAQATRWRRWNGELRESS